MKEVDPNSLEVQKLLKQTVCITLSIWHKVINVRYKTKRRKKEKENRKITKEIQKSVFFLFFSFQVVILIRL
jgi:ribosomal protein S26